MTDNLLTNTSDALRKLGEAEDRFRRTRNEVNRLRKEMEKTDRKKDWQQKTCLGAALLLAAKAYPQNAEKLRRLVLPFITRDTDRAALQGTVFDPHAEASVSPAGEDNARAA